MKQAWRGNGLFIWGDMGLYWWGAYEGEYLTRTGIKGI